jgi:hypothetical protein
MRLQVSAFLYRTLCCVVPRCLVEWNVVVLEGVCYRLLEGHRPSLRLRLLEGCVTQLRTCGRDGAFVQRTNRQVVVVDRRHDGL